MWVDMWGDLPGQLVVVSGASGSGKSSVIREVLKNESLNIQLSVSATTRDPRPGETNCVDYFFLKPHEFQEANDQGEFLETAVYNNHYYGTPSLPVFVALSKGKSVLLEIDVQGAKQVRESAPTALFVFIRTLTFRVLEQRLRERGTETNAVIHRRLRTARHELAEAHWYDHQIINDDFDRCVGEFINVLRANGCGG